ncbi:SusD/RagB family nutrient-binding outer membrane lipoprotein [Hufsiella ginkgonis]|uniref:SusD/RagB family nutrient-binding outer membrane lipoprotein n=1 Tax=Hufsiella ginkgonis TaxID=2695274 RepID=A0A7K1XUB7_9SPHI|nr:SusD/RagB family nutrient-binding outer membrane lipoprotein [Hufsiella ginkgonis]MXV14359.1 SusD/RagB family nutrient-binding outer membrane lipoprotein [Hufsiella ginkgonis]
MMKIKFIKYIAVVALATSVSSCDMGDFGDINVSPNSPDKIITKLLLTNAERSVAGVISAPAPRLYIQHLSETLYTSESRYNTKIYDYSSVYNGPLYDLTTIIKLNTDAATKGDLANVLSGGTNANQIAAARILRAFFFLNLTDRFGDIPYSEALQGINDVTPAFDTQQSIYTSLFKELKESVAQFEAGTISGDILFGGNTAKWKLFANTMRMYMGLRLSKIDPTTGKAEFNAALTAGVLASNADNISYAYLAESANENNIYNNYEVSKRYDYSISKTVVDALKANNDPRLPVYAEKTSAGTYVGMPYGITQAAAAASYTPGNLLAPGNISLIGSKFRLQNSPVAIYTYSQVAFAKAEAYKLGWITGAPDDVQAAAQYVIGIQSSMTANGVAAADATTYLAATGVPYDPANGIKQIITQKWISTYMGYGYEAWADFRRTGFPTLSPSPNAQSIDKQIPRRQVYVAAEKELNKANYDAVVARQGPDELATRVWWDKP